MYLYRAGTVHRNLSFPQRLLQRVAIGIEYFLFNHFDVLITAFFGFLVLAAVIDPILSYVGLDVIAKPLYSWMHVICAQTPSHSFHLFGHQFCLCERCLAMHSSFFLGGIIFIVSKKRLRGMPWWGLILVAIPMALDGFTQLFGLRESTWELRLLTGGIFGLGASLFLLPFVWKTLSLASH
jgi:uncharacterized membrane protein